MKALEERGIGRPSTYATIISTLLNRNYAELKGRALKPTDGGRIVSGFLTTNFTRYVDYDFTAHMEDELDEVSRGEREWVPVLEEFWKPFAVLLKEKEKSVTREEAVQVRELGTDPNSGRPVSARFGRFGPFIQIGTREDEEKPKWKGLQPGQSMFTIQLPDALELFKLPRALGNLPTGEPVSTNTGQFGPYVQYETIDQATGEVKKKYVSLREHDPYKITLEEAIEVIRAKQEADANKLIKDYGVDNLRLLRGRWGPVPDRRREERAAAQGPGARDHHAGRGAGADRERAAAEAPLGPARDQEEGHEEGGEEGGAKGCGGRRPAATARKRPGRRPKAPEEAARKPAKPAQEGRGEGRQGQGRPGRQRRTRQPVPTRLARRARRARHVPTTGFPGSPTAPRRRRPPRRRRHRLPHRGRLRAGLPSRRRPRGPAPARSEAAARVGRADSHRRQLRAAHGLDRADAPGDSPALRPRRPAR